MLSRNTVNEILRRIDLPVRSRKENMKVTRLVAGGLASLTLPLVMLAGVPAQANSSEASVSAGWLAGKVQPDGLLHTQWGADYGLSVDALVTLQTLGGQASTVAAISNGLAANPQAYISGEAFGDTGSTYAGATGKLTFALKSTGKNVTNVADINLVERLESVIVTEGANTGRGMDVSSWGDYSNGVGQSWVTRALVAVDSSLADEAVNYVLSKQCTDGGFPTDLNAATCASGHDTTAYTIVALQEAKAAGVIDGATLDTAISKAVTSLKNAQGADGSLGAGDGINSNTTGLAADKAVTWLRTVYAKPVGPLASQAGAIAFNKDAFDTATAAGAIPAEAADQWVRATAQAAIAWAGASDPIVPVEPEINVTAPGTVTAGEEFLIQASGYPEGEVVTIDLSMNGAAAGKSFAGFKFAVLGTVTANSAGTISHTATAPATPGNYTLSLISTSGVFTAPITVAAAGTGGNDGTGGTDAEGDDSTKDSTTSDLSRTDNDVTAGLIGAGVLAVLAGAFVAFVARRREV